MATFSKEDNILIKSLYGYEGYARQFTTEFPDKGWTKNNINMLTPGKNSSRKVKSSQIPLPSTQKKLCLGEYHALCTVSLLL